ncbi:transposase [uncultured Meiothermus sp.]|jgi:REP element-mobilizing transposase RayT|uniref:transposase n=1 Tax=uncultured Meiothermus sp. TaxID=157471 RepID=UPI002614642B|nr:transposase [uncultured Meiothermus sp.]
MPYDPERHHRRSIRLKGYDYSQAGAYFVTINVHQRRCLLGEVVGGKVRLSPAGEMVLRVWEAAPNHYPGVDVDAFVVMPNHVHGIILLTTSAGAAPRGRPDPPQANQFDPDDDDPPLPPGNSGQALGPAPTTGLRLADVVGRFKSLTTRRYIAGVRTLGWVPFDRYFWQRNYHERILRNENELNVRRWYIEENPLRWDSDKEKLNRL